MGVLDGLNDRQRAAAEHTEGPLLILAGAGSGKTRTIIQRIAHILDEELAWPSQILAITFTNKAAGEMRERLEALHIEDIKRMWVSTFHAMCARILRMYADLLGYTKSFTIYDTDDQRRLYKQIIKQLGISDKTLPYYQVSAEISKAKNDGLTAAAFEKLYAGDRQLKDVSAYYKAYERTMRENDAMDFDDLIFNTLRLFKQEPEVLRRFQDRFKYILVDEYQDTNHSQYELVNLLAAGWRNLCVCGDDDQSIYGWRGADIGNILDFEKDYPDAKVVKLEENYRSTPLILDLANAVIKKNRKRKDKALWTGNPETEGNEKVTVGHLDQGMDEARWVVDQIKNLKAQYGYSFDDFTILYRTNAQSRLFEERLMREGIPYKLIGGTGFYARQEIKDMLAYLTLLVNPKDELSLTRIINMPRRGIGEAAIGKLREYQQLRNTEDGENFTLMDAVKAADRIPSLTPGIRSKIKGFGEMIERFTKQAEESKVEDLIADIFEKSGYSDYLLSGKIDNGEIRTENVQELIAAAREFTENSDDPSLRAFLETVALTSDSDKYESNEGQVLLMTLHTAKGLEFPVVFMVGMEENLFPSRRAAETEHGLEEERRLCYVGITRAKERLYLSYVDYRNLYGNFSLQLPSMFLDELPADLITFEETSTPRRGKKENRPSSAKNFQKEISKNTSMRGLGSGAKTSSFFPGAKVKHKSFGIGTVIEVKPHILSIAFPGIGIKKLDPGFVQQAD